MLEMIKDTDNYLLVKPYTITVTNNNIPIKKCRVACTFSSTNKLKAHLTDIFTKRHYKHYFNDKNKSLLLMYLLDTNLELHLELVVLDNTTNKIKRFTQAPRPNPTNNIDKSIEQIFQG